jgi:hypothetical protein
MCQVLYRDDGAPLGCVLRLKGSQDTYAYTTRGALRRLGFVPPRPGARSSARSALREGALW